MSGKANVKRRRQAVAVCSFCGKPNTEVERLVAGPGVYICDECVGLCVEIIAAERDKAAEAAESAQSAQSTEPAESGEPGESGKPGESGEDAESGEQGEVAEPAMPRLWDRVESVEAALKLLPKMAAAGAQVEENLTALVRRARALGATWAKIGEALGMTRQSAWERFSGEE